jgi:hypothetical protein
VAGDVHGQFEAAPDADFIKCAAQMILDHLHPEERILQTSKHFALYSLEIKHLAAKLV